MPSKVGLATFGSFVIVGFAPVLIYVLDFIFKLNLNNLFFVSSLLAAASFAGIGWLKSYVADESKAMAIAETLVLGAIAASVAYYIGDVLESVVLS